MIVCILLFIFHNLFLSTFFQDSAVAVDLEYRVDWLLFSPPKVIRNVLSLVKSGIRSFLEIFALFDSDDVATDG